jgi:hypothetical protein
MLEGISKNLVSLYWPEVAEENYESNNRNNWLSSMELKRDVSNASKPPLSAMNVESTLYCIIFNMDCHGNRNIQQEEGSFHQKIRLKFREETSKGLYGVETWASRKVGQK